MSLRLATISLLGSGAASASAPLWPQPVESSVGSSVLEISSDFIFKQDGGDPSAFLNQAMSRYTELIKGPTSARRLADAPSVHTCAVQVQEYHDNEPDTLLPGVDESYTLSVDGNGVCAITSKTVWGALHAMETFTQLLERGGDTTAPVSLPYAPVSVSDAPRFTHRGLLIDSSRHYLPVSEIERLIDSLPMSKLNVLHWHMVDAQVACNF